MAEDARDEGMPLLGDALFGSVKVRKAKRNLSLSYFMCSPMWDMHLPLLFHMHAVVALVKMKGHFIGVVKTSHALFLKALFQESMCTAHAWSIVHLITNVEDVQLVATCYKYNRSKVLFFSTVGARGMADSNPYI
jgi:hypothetical protein